MANIMRADLYRIFKTKGVYITLAVYAVLIAITVMLNLTMAVGVNASMLEENPAEDVVQSIEGDDGTVVRVITPPVEKEIMTGKTVLFKLARNTDNLVYFIMPFIIFIAAVDFSNGTVKNLIASGFPRVKLFFSKLILTAGVCIILSLINILLPLTIATVKNGFGGDFDMAFVTDVLNVYLPQTFLVFAFACIGIFMTFAFKKTAIINTAYIAFSLLPIMIIAILTEFFPDMIKLMDFELISNIKMFAYSNTEAPADMGRALLMGSVYIVLSVVGGILAFRRSEIK